MIGFIAKRELLYIPVLNLWIAMIGGLFIDRKNPRKALKTINKGIKHIKGGGAMIIFPEGTRSRGRGLQPFHPGSFKLATQAETVIVPVALSGTYEIFERNYRVNPVPVRISYCKPVNTADIPPGDRKQILADQIHDMIKGELEGGTVDK
jgi:1-acyl-sn-glycerol-3-phosphate acyltransferase